MRWPTAYYTNEATTGTYSLFYSFKGHLIYEKTKTIIKIYLFTERANYEKQSPHSKSN